MAAKPRLLGTASLLGVAMLCTACSQTALGGTPVTTGAGTQSSASAPTSGVGETTNGAPKVVHPVDVAKFKTRPCDFLTESQLKTLGVTATPKTVDVPETGILCQWPGDSDQPSVAVGILPNPNGLSDVYGKKNELDEFGAVPDVNGFPAVKSLFAKGSPNDCGYSIGVNDRTAVYVLVSNSTNGDPCNAVLQVAKDVTLTARSGS